MWIPAKGFWCSTGPYLVVCAHVQHNRQALHRWHAPAGRVESQLPHRDTHAVAAQVPQPQDPLSVRHAHSL